MAQPKNAAADQTLKILMLHGYTQSGSLFRAKTAFLEAALKKAFPTRGIKLVYPTAPHRLGIPSLSAPTHSGHSRGDDGDPDPDSWAWLQKDEQTGEYVGIEVSFDFLAEVLRTQGPFTGVIGFSQGAAVAAMLASLLEGTSRISSFLAHQSSGGIAFPGSIRSLYHPRLKFAVAYSGFLAADPRYAACFEPQIETPVLHVLGSLDGIVDEQRSLSLVEACVGGKERVVYHPGGHFVPGSKPYVGALVGFMREALRKESEDAKASRAITEEPHL